MIGRPVFVRAMTGKRVYAARLLFGALPGYARRLDAVF